MHSPFPYDRLSTLEEFFGREEELEKLTNTVKYSNNLLIHSKRRMGKSSLINYFFEQHKEDYLCIYVDIFDITSKEHFAHSLLRAFSNSHKSDIKTTIKNLTALFKRVRIEPSIDPATLEYSIKPIVATLSFEEMMNDFFDSMTTLSKSKQIVLAIDEFQQIANITDVKLDALLRKYIQNRENISYIFLGSKRHMLTSLFEYKAPLYELATHYELQPLKVDDIYNYAKRFLDLDTDMVDYIYEKSDGETKMVQNILHLLYINREKKVSKELIDEAINEILGSKDSSYKIIFDTLNNNQKIALKIVGKYKRGFFAAPILNEYNIKKQTLQSAIDALFKKEFIDKEGDKYFIPDRSLELWVENL